MKSLDKYHVQCGIKANLPTQDDDNELELLLRAELEYPEEEISADANLHIFLTGVTNKFGATARYNMTKLMSTHLYKVLRSPSTMLGPFVFPSGLYDLGSKFDQIEFELQIDLSESGRYRNVSYTSVDPEKLGCQVSDYLSISGLMVQNILNAISKLYIFGENENLSAADLNAPVRNVGLETGLSGKLVWLLPMLLFFLFNVIFFSSRNNSYTHFSMIRKSRYGYNITTPSQFLHTHDFILMLHSTL
jgi:hypothetical protein